MIAAIPLLLSVLKVGVIGCDTCHALEFTKIMNGEKPAFAEGLRMTHAYKFGSKDLASCTNAYGLFIPQMEKLGVKMVDSIDELLRNVDVVCLETCDGRPHPEQAEQVFKSGKRVFIDKPIGANWADAKRIYEMGKRYNASYFTSSALRYSDAQQDCRNGKYGKILGAYYFAPSPLEEQGTHARYTWYGIHGFEPLVTVMGTGVESVRAWNSGKIDEIQLRWKDGRLATLRLNQEAWIYGGYAFYDNEKDPVKLDGYDGYMKLLERICKFFKDGVVPVAHEETLEIFAAMEAAERSLRENGREVKLAEVL